MEPLKEIRFGCLQCGNCCLDKNTLVNLTYSDILRIKEELKLDLDELLEIIGFYIFEKTPMEEELKKMVVPPIQTEQGLAFIGLKKKINGSCYFYDIANKKCKIYKLRPNFCRTFPFSFKVILNKEDEKKDIEIFYTDKSIEYCPGIGNDAPLIDDLEWSKLGKTTIKDLLNNNVLIQKWNEAVKKGTISKSAKNFLLTIINLEKKKNK